MNKCKHILFNLNDPSKSNGYNPLQLPYYYYKKGNKDKAIELINEVALEMFKDDSPNTDPFWANSCSSYFTGITLILFKEGNENEINLGSVYAMIIAGEEKNEDETNISKYMKNMDIMNPIYINLSATLFAPSETKGSILSVLKQKISYCVSKETLLNVLCSNEIKVEKIGNKIALFIIGNPAKPESNILGNILINQTIQFTNENNIEFTYYLDNFETMPTLLKLNELLGNASINNSKVFVAFKDKEELLYKYGQFIINRFSNVIETKEEVNLINLGNYNEYPNLKLKQNQYFNFSEFMKK